MATFMEILPDASVSLLLLGMFLAFYRMVRGPTRADRVVALDLVSLLAIGIVAVYAIDMDDPLFVDVAIVWTITSFLASIGLARYLHRCPKGS